MDMPNYLYHYTSEECAEKIQYSGFIDTSTDTTRDAVGGEGVYLTSIPPTASDEMILRNNYGVATGKHGRVAVCFKFWRNALPEVRKVPDRNGRDIWVNTAPIGLDTPHEVINRSEEDSGVGTAMAVGGAVVGIAALVLGAKKLFDYLDEDPPKQQQNK